MGDFPSGQRGQTVNLLAMPSVVRIHHPPPEKDLVYRQGLFQLTPPFRVGEKFLRNVKYTSTASGQIIFVFCFSKIIYLSLIIIDKDKRDKVQ